MDIPEQSRLIQKAVWLFGQVGQRDGLNIFRQWISVRTEVNNQYFGQFQVSERRAHGRGQTWGVHALAFHANPLAIFEQEQIEFCPRVSSPKIGFIGRGGFDDFFDNIAFPRCTTAWVQEKILLGANA